LYPTTAAPALFCVPSDELPVRHVAACAHDRRNRYTLPKELQMHAVVVYESMFGNTHTIADHVGEGLTAAGIDVAVVSLHDASDELIASADLLVVGGPTHVHGMSTKLSRSGVDDMAAKEGLDLDPDREGEGLRDWFDQLPRTSGRSAAAFDTRVHATTLLTGQASKGISKRLRAHGFTMVADPESFFVDKSTHLEPAEVERATEWGRALAAAVAADA
jgi:sulfite reductase alpha subunit-like flavoprotein